MRVLDAQKFLFKVQKTELIANRSVCMRGVGERFGCSK